MRYKIIILFIVFIANGLTNASPLNLLISIPQLLVIMYFILTNKINSAIFWHFIFFITSYTYYGNAEEIQLVSYNYAKLKLIGPLSYSVVISIILFFRVSFNYSFNIRRDELFHSLYKTILLMMLIGLINGFIGLIFLDYFIEGFLNYASYIIIIFLHLHILIMANSKLKEEFYSIVIPLLALCQISQTILSLLVVNIHDTPGVAFFSLLLVPSLLYTKDIRLSIAGLISLFYNMINSGTGGKSLIFLLIVVILTIIYSNSKVLKIKYPIKSRVIRIVLISFLLIIPGLIAFLGNYYGGSSFTISKIHQVDTLLDYLFFSNDFNSIAPSPYIRMASLKNIIYEGIQNPYFFVFGKGYGGYFQDHFNYFSHLNLYNGAFSDKAIANSKFYSGHDSIVTIPMLNGLLGVILILRIAWKYLKHAKYNYLSMASIPFLLLAFNFNNMIGVTGVLLMYLGTEKLILKGEIKKVTAIYK